MDNRESDMFLALFVYGITLACALALVAAIWRNDGPYWALGFGAVVIFAACM